MNNINIPQQTLALGIIFNLGKSEQWVNKPKQ